MIRNILTECKGINNKSAFTSLAGGELEAAMDFVIDKGGKLKGLKGNSRILTGKFLTGFPVVDGFYAAKDRTTDSAIYKYIVSSTGAVTENGIVSGLAKGAFVSWCQVGSDVYYSNGFQHGRINGELAYDWPDNEWGRETTAQFISMPVANHIDVLSGRVVGIVGDELIYSEPWMFGLVDNTRNWRRFESRGLMICSVGTGLYVSDERAVYFLAGTNPNEWVLREVLHYPAIEFGKHPTLVNPSQFGFKTSNPSALFATVNGPVVGLPDGSVFNLIDKKIKLGGGYSKASVMIVDETLVLQSGV